MLFPRLLLAGAHSGVGKTTLSLALMAVLKRKGLTVQPFKVGPDYIDPSYHCGAAGNQSHNLDAWLMDPQALHDLFFRYAACSFPGCHNAELCQSHSLPSPKERKAISLIEGVMGLYDGLGTSARGSSAHVASIIGAPVVLIINGAGMALSAAALIQGFAFFSPDETQPRVSCPHDNHVASTLPFPALPGIGMNNASAGPRINGVIINRVSGASHYKLLKQAIETHTGIPCLGWFGKNSITALPSRHLGLIPAEEQQDLEHYFSQLADAAEEGLDIDSLLALADSAGQPDAPIQNSFASSFASKRPLRIGVARDAAFSFIYRANLDILKDLGCELVFFSPLVDPGLPEKLDGLYLCGGFPEVFAVQLEGNTTMRQSVNAALQSGLPCYAECGGMLYLCKGLCTVRNGDTQHREYAMAGFFSATASMTKRLQHFGYVKVTINQNCVIGQSGQTFHAHEFHYSILSDDIQNIVTIAKTDGRHWAGGLSKNNTFAMYPHVHFQGSPLVAHSFIETCRSAKK